MPDQSNRLVVTYPNGQVRVRNVQSTACPTRSQLGYVCDINMWYLHIRMVTDMIYNAHNAIDTTIATDMLVQQANEIINGPSDFLPL